MSAYWMAFVFIGLPILAALPGIIVIAKFLAEGLVERLFDDERKGGE